MTTPALARTMWEAVERYHGACYTAPEPRATAAAAGLKGFWMAYFATRAAPLGPVPAEVVEATFFYYSPVRVRRAIPDAWSFSSPERALAARYEGMDAALRRFLGTGPGLLGSPEVEEAAALAREAADRMPLMGRTLAAGWSSLPWPDEPHLALWHACTLLREGRSGTHLIALAAHGLDGCQSVVSHVAAGAAPRAWIRDEAAWSEDDEAVAVDALRQRGWLDADGAITEAGTAGREAVERLTDELDSPHWLALGEHRCGRLAALMGRLDAPLPPDDQLDWESLYPDEGTA
jgi:hypothetical protein